jgi:hypothetical protein
MKLGAHTQLRPTREAAMAAFAKELAEGMTKPCSRSKAAPDSAGLDRPDRVGSSPTS